MIAIERANATFQKGMKTWFSTLSRISNWANARDVETLAQAMFRRSLKTMDHDSLVLDESNVLGEMDQMINGRMKREMPSSDHGSPAFPQSTGLAFDNQSSHAPTTRSTVNTDSDQQPPQINEEKAKDMPRPVEANTRDPGVSDALWDQLQKDEATEESREEQYQKLVQSEDSARKAAEDAKNREETAAVKEMSDQNKDDDEAKKRHEQERLQHELERRSYEERLDKLRRKREEEQKRRKQEQEAQEKLRYMGVYCVGYRWIKQASGYRCAGGSHYVSNEELGM